MLARADSVAADTVVVVVGEAVAADHAPVPANDAERLLFRQAYATLVRLDCRGRLRPGLAGSWAADSGGRRWRFALRTEARFADGTPLDAAQVRASWLAGADTAARLGWAGIERVDAPEPHTLDILFSSPQPEVPSVLADPRLAPTRPGSGAWPVGAGGFVLRDDLADRGTRGTRGTRGPRVLALPTGAGRPVLAFRTAPARDPRDAIDAGGDLTISRDPAVLDYAARRPGLALPPLPWDRTYVLLEAAEAPPSPEPERAAAARAALAADAVRTEARGAVPPFCAAAAVDVPPAVSARRVVYPAGDSVAAQLAERLVALATGSSQAATLEPSALAASLARGHPVAYVLPLVRDATGSCRLGAGTGVAGIIPAGLTIVPLVETRARAVVRRGAVTIAADGDGTVRVLPEAPPDAGTAGP